MTQYLQQAYYASGHMLKLTCTVWPLGFPKLFRRAEPYGHEGPPESR